MRLVCGHIEVFAPEADMTQACVGYHGEGCNTSLLVHMEHSIVTEVDDIQLALVVEGNPIRTFEEVALGELGDCTVWRNMRDAVSAAVRDIDIIRIPGDSDSDGSVEASCGE